MGCNVSTNENSTKTVIDKPEQDNDKPINNNIITNSDFDSLLCKVTKDGRHKNISVEGICDKCGMYNVEVVMNDNHKKVLNKKNSNSSNELNKNKSNIKEKRVPNNSKQSKKDSKEKDLGKYKKTKNYEERDFETDIRRNRGKPKNNCKMISINSNRSNKSNKSNKSNNSVSPNKKVFIEESNYEFVNTSIDKSKKYKSLNTNNTCKAEEISIENGYNNDSLDDDLNNSIT